jgi:replication factor A3
MSEATPRITAPYLEQFSHQTVRILGKVRQLRGEQATIDAGGQISVFLNRVCNLCAKQLGRAHEFWVIYLESA